MKTSRHNLPEIPRRKELEAKLDEINKTHNKKFWLDRAITTAYWDEKVIIQDRICLDLRERLENGTDKDLSKFQRPECLLQFILGLEKGLEYGQPG